MPAGAARFTFTDMRRGILMLIAVLAALGVAHTGSIDGTLASWQSLAAKVAELH